MRSLTNPSQTHSALPTRPGCRHTSQVGKPEGAPRGPGTGRGPPTAGLCGPHAATLAALPTLSISLALFSHSPTSRPPVSSSWRSSMLPWAATGSGEASSRPGMTQVLFPGPISHRTPRDLGPRATFCAHSPGLEASGVNGPRPGPGSNPWSQAAPRQSWTVPGEDRGVRTELSHRRAGWEPALPYLLQLLLHWAATPAEWHPPERVLALRPAPVAGSEAAPQSGPVAALATALEVALVAAPLAGPWAVFLPGPVDMSVSVPASAAVAAPALGAAPVPVAAPVAAPASVALPPSAPAAALSALERSVSVPASAALAAPGRPQAASVAESVAAPGPGSAEPVAGIVAALGLPVGPAAARASASASVLSSGPGAGPSPAAALGVPFLWAPLS